jgi:hypothetical protein
LTRPESSSRPEAAFVLLLIQSLCWMIAGIAAAPFALAGEIFMAALAGATLLLALATCLVAIGVVWRRRRARTVAIVLEVVCLLGSALLLLIPIGANRGPVSLMVNIALPVGVILLLRRSAAAEAFS